MTDKCDPRDLFSRVAKHWPILAFQGGNCGQVAFGIAKYMVNKGQDVGIAFLTNNDFEDEEELTQGEPNVYHVLLQTGDKFFDVSGEQTPDSMIIFASREYGDESPALWYDFDTGERTRRIISTQTQWADLEWTDVMKYLEDGGRMSEADQNLQNQEGSEDARAPEGGWPEGYDAPYSKSEIRKHYKDRAVFLLSDPVHRWRAETGIEIIHKEPSLSEFNRIWKNWQMMTSDMKNRSDEKSRELFGESNADVYKRLLSSYHKSNHRILEGSYTEPDIPEYFYLAFPLTSRSVASLKARRFEGCKGVSSSPDIAKVDESYRLRLKMKGRGVLGKNKLSRLLYSNPDYLVSNDLAALRRIALTDRPADMIYQTFQDDISLLPSQDDFGMVFKAFSDYKKRGKRINSVADLFLFIRSVIPYLNLTSESESEWRSMSIEEYRKRILPRWLARFSETFALEEEWILKDQTLTVPEDSTILVSVENMSIPRNKRDALLREIRDAGYPVVLQRRKHE